MSNKTIRKYNRPHGDEAFQPQHEQRDICPMNDEPCGCYVDHEACLKAEREMQADLDRALEFGKFLDFVMFGSFKGRDK